MSAFVDQTATWDIDRDPAEVKRQVVEMLSPLLRPEEYELYETSSLPQGAGLFDPAAGGLIVLKLFIAGRDAPLAGGLL